MTSDPSETVQELTSSNNINDDDNFEEDDECPICLDPLPPLTWRGTERVRLLCCGKLMCAACTEMMQKQPRERADNLRARLEGRPSRWSDLEEVLQVYLAHLCSNKCPMCREDVPITSEDRLRLIQNNAQRDKVWAWHKMGMYYKDLPRPDYANAIDYFQRACAHNWTNSQHEMGNLYLTGNGVPQNFSIACEWYQRAVESGNLTLAKHQLGRIWAFGEGGVPAQPARGVELLQQAAHEDYDPAQCDLAYCYEHGIGVPHPSLELSLLWNHKAAQQGNATAMANYAGNRLQWTALRNGGRADRALPECLYWARRAVRHGNADAASFVHQLEVNSQCCAGCTKEMHNLKRCQRCTAVSYCSKDCQKQHWKSGGHKVDCFDVKKADLTYNTTRK